MNTHVKPLPSFLTRWVARMKSPTSLLAAACLAWGMTMATDSHAQSTTAVPGFISYQGKVTDASGNPIGASPTPVNRSVIFRIWSHPTNSGVSELVYSEQQTVTISDGEFSALIGQGAALSDQPLGFDESGKGPPSLSVGATSIFAGTDRYLGVTIDDGSNAADAEISPRQRMVSSAFSMRSKVAETLSTGSSNALTATDNGNVGVGTDSPSANLHVRGDIRSGAAGTQAPQVTLMASSDTVIALTMGYANATDAFSPAAVAGDSVIRTDNNGKLILQSGVSEAGMVIDQFNDVYVTHTLSARLLHASSNRPSHPTGGAWLEWDKQGAGKTYLLNQKNTGAGGFVFGEVDTANSWTEHLVITGAGSVGVGTNPGAKFHVEDPTDPNILLTHSGAGTQMGLFFGDTTTGIARQGNNLQLLRGTGNIYFGGWGTNTPMSLIPTNATSGRLAINNSAPAAALSVRADVGMTKVAEWASAPTAATVLNLHLEELWDDGAGVVTGQYLAMFDIDGPPGGFGAFGIKDHLYVQGHMGIGTLSPRAGLDVVTRRFGQYIPAYRYVNSVESGNGGPATSEVSIWASGRIVTEFELNVTSDERIKSIEGPSSGPSDLATLMDLEVTDYHYIDTVANGGQAEKKVIAQQVEQVYPLAVDTHVGVVPDIFDMATLVEGWIQLDTDLTVGERVQLIAEAGEQAIYEVTAIDDGRFQVDRMPKGDEVFVYGREVDDLRTVDYDALAMLNISATQEIKREKDAEIEALTTIVEDLLERVAELEAQLGTQ